MNPSKQESDEIIKSTCNTPESRKRKLNPTISTTTVSQNDTKTLKLNLDKYGFTKKMHENDNNLTLSSNKPGKDEMSIVSEREESKIQATTTMIKKSVIKCSINPPIQDSKLLDSNIPQETVNLLDSSKNLEKPIDGYNLKTKDFTLISPDKLIKDKRLRDFEIDSNDKSKIFCKFCFKSYVPRLSDILEHMNSDKHQNAKRKSSQSRIDTYGQGKEIARSEIIWTYFTLFRNLSFNLSDYCNEYLSHMLRDSEIGKSINLHRHKTKYMIQKVFLGSIIFKRIQFMRKIHVLMIDGSRDISNNNQIIIACRFFNEIEGRIKNLVYEVLEINHSKAIDIYHELKKFFNEDRILFKNTLALITDNAPEMISQDHGVLGYIQKENKSIFGVGCVCHKLNLIVVHILDFLLENIENFISNAIVIPDLISKLCG